MLLRHQPLGQIALYLIVLCKRQINQYDISNISMLIGDFGCGHIAYLYYMNHEPNTAYCKFIMKNTEWGILFNQNPEEITKQKPWVRRAKGFCLGDFWWGSGCAKYRMSVVFIFGTACQIYCYGRYCVTQSVSPKVPENPSGPLVDNFIVLPCVACGVVCVKLLPGVDGWNSLDDPRVIGPCHCEVWGWPRHQADFDWFFGRPIFETSRRGASFRVTHTANRKC